MHDNRAAEPVEVPDLPYVKMIQRGQLLAVHVRRTEVGPAFAVPGFGIGHAFMAVTYLRAMEVEV